MTRDFTKNDKAWRKLFYEYKILQEIDRDGFYYITSQVINQYRESRLMTKIDHQAQLPLVFKENSLSILPVSRGSYVIGRFATYFPLTYSIPRKLPRVTLPEEIETIDSHDLYSEHAAILFAYNSGMFDSLAQGTAYYTLGGRMSTGEFHYNISLLHSNRRFEVKVSNAQCEIDAGFESDSKLLIIEAKNQLVSDFLIRQIYYPYRTWEHKVSKTVEPIVMTYSNGIFSFFRFVFKDPNNYNSLELTEQRHYTTTAEDIYLEDVFELFSSISPIDEPPFPFPQADSFQRIIDLLGFLANGNMSREEITSTFDIDPRQTHYYTRAAMYLGLVEESYDPEVGWEKRFALTQYAKQLLQKSHKERNLGLIKAILERPVFYNTFELMLKKNDTRVDKREVARIISSTPLHSKLDSHSTIERRAQTVISWLNWIFDQVEL